MFLRKIFYVLWKIFTHVLESCITKCIFGKCFILHAKCFMLNGKDFSQVFESGVHVLMEKCFMFNQKDFVFY